MTSHAPKTPLHTFTMIVIILGIMIILGAALLVFAYFPQIVKEAFGEINPRATLLQRITLPIKLLWEKQSLYINSSTTCGECTFLVSDSESVYQLAERLFQDGTIQNPEAMVDYMIYTGIDRSILTGRFVIPPGSNAMQVAQILSDPSRRLITVVILPGWRLEEIVDSMKTAGLDNLGDELLLINPDAAGITLPEQVGPIHSLEGYLAPGEYLVSHSTTASQFSEMGLEKTADALDSALVERMASSGFTLQEVLTLASIIQREAQKVEEMPTIASVFLNRLNRGMRLESDPTVQYALGYDPAQLTWWRTSLSYEDLAVASSYNTYLNDGLPPTPICAPSLEAILSVLDAPATDYLFFRAACDGSGYHQFSETFSEHLAKACP